MCIHCYTRALTCEINQHIWSISYEPGLVLGSGGSKAGVGNEIQRGAKYYLHVRIFNLEKE